MVTSEDSDPPPFDPRPGVAQELEPGLRRILAPNPSAMTHGGTNTYLLGTRGLAVIDPGPDLPAHLQALLAALRPGQSVTHILVTHAHRDHSGLAPALARATGAPVLAYGDALAGRSAVMQALAAQGLAGGGAGLDPEFAPDRALTDGETVAGDGWQITALWTPGHSAGHLSLAWNDAVFSGDTVMGWASTLVSPPDGDLSAFLASTRRLQALGARRFYPGHGAPVTDPSGRCAWLLAHRAEREAQILAELARSPRDAAGLAAAIYTEIPPALRPAAERNVLAHLIDLATRNRVVATPVLSATARFAPA